MRASGRPATLGGTRMERVTTEPADNAIPDQHQQGFTARATRAADHTHLTPDLVERLPFDLSALDADGVFVNVDARGFGLLDRRLDWQTLGVSLPRGGDLAFRPPRCGLLPDRYRLPLLRPAARAHAALRRYSFRFT